MRILTLVALAATTLISSAETEERAEDIEKLRAAAQAYVDAFNEQDADAIAALFLPNGEVHSADGEITSGAEAIQARYEGMFEDDEKRQAALEVGALRFVSPGVAIEEGTVHITHHDGELTSHHYTAVHVEQTDGEWKTARVRDEVQAIAEGHDRLAELSWLIGDWMIEASETRTYIAIDWSDDGPFIDGKAVSENANSFDTKATMRIAWDAERDTFVSWHYDADGGYNFAEWSRKGDRGWLIRHMGITSDGEKMRATREVTLDANGESFTWNSRDMTIDGELLSNRELRVVKRPPAPNTEGEKP